ncbi:MAG: class I tRNA ligase family protein, partial [Ureaplasma sp.]|nr:class I tRNA ligase family protein [Ureaplasma sp.]
MNKKAFISTPIYYASGNPHIGHAYTTLLADVLSRYKKMLGYDVFFVTGTDEFGQKIQTLAKANNLSEQEFVDNNCKKFIDLFNKLGIEYNGFSRTTNPNHIKTVQKVFSQMIKNDDIYLDNWNGYYCVSCEENYTKSQIVEKDGEMFCNVGHKIVKKNEESYFFKMSKYNKWISSFLDSNPNLIYPQHRVNELKNNFLKDLTDLSVSRTTTTWGIPIIENSNHKIYVWVDALFNYLTILGYLQSDDSNYKN